MKFIILSLLMPLSASALTIVPKSVESQNDGDGGTSHDHIHCVFRKSGHPKLIQCYLTIGGNLMLDLSVHMTLKKNGETIAGTPLNGYSKNPGREVFNFAVHIDLLKESHVDIHCEAGFFRIAMDDVEVIEAPTIEDDVFGGGSEGTQ